jgi:hypothetical protein
MISGIGSEHDDLRRATRTGSSPPWYLATFVCLNIAAAVCCRCAASTFPAAVDGYVCTGIFCALNAFGLSVFGYVKCLEWCGRIIDAQRRARAARLGVESEPIDPRPFLGWVLAYAAALYAVDQLVALIGVPRLSYGYIVLLAASIIVAVWLTGGRFRQAARGVYDSNLKPLCRAEKLVLVGFGVYLPSWIIFMSSLPYTIDFTGPSLALVVAGCSPFFAGVFFAFAMMRAGFRDSKSPGKSRQLPP